MNVIIGILIAYASLVVLGLLWEAVSKLIDSLASWIARNHVAKTIDTTATLISILSMIGVVGTIVLFAAQPHIIFILLPAAATLFLILTGVALSRAAEVSGVHEPKTAEVLRTEQPMTSLQGTARAWAATPEAVKLAARDQAERSFDYIKSLSGHDFERHVEATYKRLGYRVKRVGRSGDQGVDHIVTKKGVKTALQCKRYKGSVGNDAVQQAISGSIYYGCDRTTVVTTSVFTKSAKELAKRVDVELIDGEAYMRMVEHRNPSSPIDPEVGF